MKLEKIQITDKTKLDFIERLYIESFPVNERRSVEAFRKLLKENPDFTVCLVRDKDVKVGFLTYWTFDNFIYAEHFAISSEFRNGGYGKQVMDAFIQQTTLPLILEVELPESGMAERRIGFYKRIGFRLWDIEYEQPPYEKAFGPVPMKLMTYRTIDLDKVFKEVKSEIYRKVYGTSCDNKS